MASIEVRNQSSFDGSTRSISTCSQGNYRWPYFHNAVKITSQTYCKSWESANGELLQVPQRRSVCDIKKRNLVEMTISVHTINGVIRIKYSTCLR